MKDFYLPGGEVLARKFGDLLIFCNVFSHSESKHQNYKKAWVIQRF